MFEYIHRINPNASEEGARRMLTSAVELAKLRPKARAREEAKNAMILRDIQRMHEMTGNGL